MDNETLRLLISCGTTVLVAIITQIFIYFVTKLNNKDSKKNSILEEQYEKVFAPIHKAIFYDNIENRNRLYWEIDHIISSNYPIVPKRIRELYSGIKDNENSKFDDFKNEISICFRYSSSILGYSREKLSRNEKKTAKKILNRKSEEIILTRRLLLIMLFSGILSIPITLLLKDYITFFEPIVLFFYITLIFFAIFAFIYAFFKSKNSTK